MRNGGNELVNKLFEAMLTKMQSEVVKPDKHTELDPRSHFIYDKYQHRKWYDAKLAKEKSTFDRPVANGSQDKRVSAGEFDDFFALRTKGAAADTWHDSNDDTFEDFNPRGDSKPSSKQSVKNFHDMNNSISTPSAFESDAFDVASPGKFSTSARGGLSFTRTPKAATSEGRAKLMSTLQRMDSKREILNSIRGLNIDQENQILQPGQVATSNRRKKDRSPRGDEVLVSSERRRGSNDGDSRPRIRPTTGATRRERSGGPIRQQPPDRSRSNGSDKDPDIPRRRASDDGDARPTVATSRRQGLGKTKSIGSDDGSQKPRRRIQRTASEDSQGLDEQSELKDGTSRTRREAGRGMARTRSMGADSEHSEAPKGVRSRSIKRGVRRTASNDDYSLDGSMRSYDADASQVSVRSTTRRPPRRPRSTATPEEDNEEAIKQTNDTLSIRRSRHDDTNRRRRHSPKDSSAEGFNSRTPSPTGAPSTRPRSKLVTDVADRSTISVRRVPTVRDRSPKQSGHTSVSRSKRSLGVDLNDDVGKLFAAT